MATNTAWARTGLTGGTSTDLDGISYSSLANDDIAFVKVSNVSYEYIFDSSSTLTESSPDVITPDDYGGSPGRWVIQRVYGVSSENLLLNPNFAINQDAYNYTSDASPGDYFFDGWFNDYDEALGYSVSFTSSKLYLETDGNISQLFGKRTFISSQQILGPIEGNPLTISGDISGTVTVYAGYGSSSGASMSLSNIGTLTGTGDSITFNANYNSVQNNYLAIKITGTGGIKWLKVEEGSVKTEFEEPDFQNELLRCQYYYKKSYNYSVAPGTVTNVGSVTFKNNTGGAYTVFDALPCKVNQLHSTPSATLYSSGDGTSGTVYDIDGATNRNVSSVNDLGENGFTSITIASTPDTNRCRFHYKLDARP